ncbi:hypothetical protein NBRC116586_13070 [Pseudooceanicola nitratireducens]
MRGPRAAQGRDLRPPKRTWGGAGDAGGTEDRGGVGKRPPGDHGNIPRRDDRKATLRAFPASRGLAPDPENPVAAEAEKAIAQGWERAIHAHLPKGIGFVQSK